MKELKSKNNTIKKLAKEYFANIKLLCFIDRAQIKNFYEEILYKYRCKFPNFFKYFTNYYFKKNLFQNYVGIIV